MSFVRDLAASVGAPIQKGTHRLTAEEILARLISDVATVAPLPWERDREGMESGDSSTFDHFYVGTTDQSGKWVTLFDTSQSTAVEVSEDYDEDFYSCWDETGRRTTALALAAANTLPTMLRLLAATKALAALRPENWEEDEELVAAYGEVDAVLSDLTKGEPA